MVGLTSVTDAEFTGGEISFWEAEFSGGFVRLRRRPGSPAPGQLQPSPSFTGGEVDFSYPVRWSARPKFPLDSHVALEA